VAPHKFNTIHHYVTGDRNKSRLCVKTANKEHAQSVANVI